MRVSEAAMTYGQAVSVIKRRCDCVVMLTSADWHTEPISNRYHYATRLSKLLPVLFVQPDSQAPGYRFEATEFENITIVHVYNPFRDNRPCCRDQTEPLNLALREKGYYAPLIWMNNDFCLDYFRQAYAPLKVYHATEDYFAYDVPQEQMDFHFRHIIASLRYTDLLVSVSKPVEESQLLNGKYCGEAILAENGVDFGFWGLKDEELERLAASEPQKRVLYQGGVNKRLNFALLLELCESMPDWEFVFCGKLNNDKAEYEPLIAQLQGLKNTVFTRQLPIARVREYALSASVGLLPNRDIPWNRIALPLKSFEYVATGLPVITTCPVSSLKQFGALFSTCATAAEVKAEIERLYTTRCDRAHLSARLKAAKSVSYDERFARVIERIGQALANRQGVAARRNILYLYNNAAPEELIADTKARLDDMSHNITFTGSLARADAHLDISEYDMLIIDALSGVSPEFPSYAPNIQKFGGYKALLAGDSPEREGWISQAVSSLGVQLVFLKGAEEQAGAYEKSFPFVTFIRVPADISGEALLELVLARVPYAPYLASSDSFSARALPARFDVRLCTIDKHFFRTTVKRHIRAVVGDWIMNMPPVYRVLKSLKALTKSLRRKP